MSTVDNLADFFTKPLKASVFFPMRDAIMNVSRSESPALRASLRVSATGGSCESIAPYLAFALRSAPHHGAPRVRYVLVPVIIVVLPLHCASPCSTY